MKIISWNLLRDVGATVADVVALIARERPDLLVMQEATPPFGALCDRVGGCYAWETQPGRGHGLAMWSAVPWPAAPAVSAITRGAWFERICQIVTIGGFGVANVHLSHGQWLNRRQLREIARRLPPCAAVLGDFNIVGPSLLPGFRDVGPRAATHRMGDIVPLRIDRCLVRGLVCDEARVLPRQKSDHRPISVNLALRPAHATAPHVAAPHAAAAPHDVRYRAAAAASPHRAA